MTAITQDDHRSQLELGPPVVLVTILDHRVFVLDQWVFVLDHRVFVLDQWVFILDHRVFVLDQWVFVLDHRVFGLRSSFLGLRFQHI